MWKDWLQESWNAFRHNQRSKQPKTLEAALADLQDPSAEVRALATSELRRFKCQEAVTALVRALEDPATPVRAGAALSLGVLEEPEAVGPLLEHFLHDEARTVRLVCGSFLMKFDDPRLRSAFVSALQDPETAIVSGACLGVESLGITEAIPDLLRLLNHPEPSVRQNACSALLTLGVRNAEIISTLERLAGDPDTAEREQFGAELQRLLAEEIDDEDSPPLRKVRDLLDEARQPPHADQ